MEVMINGEPRQVEQGLTLRQLLESYQISSASVVVERNEVVVAKQDLEKVSVESGDKIEIVRFVGGGS